MTVERRPFRLTLPGAELRGDAWLPAADGPETAGRPAGGGRSGRGASPGFAIVVCHGFKGFKDWGFFPWVSEELARRVGVPVVSFNFDGAGVREETATFDDLASFSRNTFTKELFDLEAILDGLALGRLGEAEVPAASRYGLLGHSRGGATCVLKAAARRQVEALVTWASIASVERYGAYQGEWEVGRAALIPNARTGQDMPLERNVLDDFLANRARLDVPASARALDIPWAIVHGTEDESVPFSDAEALAGACPGARLVPVEGAGHTFGAGHPFTGSTPELERALDASADLFREAL